MSSAPKRQKLEAIAEKPPWIAILDFGSQYSHLIARRVREQNVYCELFSCKVGAAELAHHNLKGVILSGGPNSVYDDGAPHVESDTWEMIRSKKIPLLGICYGMQEIVHRLGGKVASCEKREYGRSVAKKTGGADGGILAGLPDEFEMWMSHGDKLITIPDGFVDLLTTANSEHAAIGNAEAGIWGFQFHPEVAVANLLTNMLLPFPSLLQVTHSPLGKDLLGNFVNKLCGCEPTWKMEKIADKFIEQIKDQVGPDAIVIGAVSGGVDSSVAAMLLHKAIGPRFHAVLVDNGFLRHEEAKEVVERLKTRVGINLHCVDASKLFLDRLKGVTDPEEKRKKIGNTFIEVFEAEAKKVGDRAQFLLQGTLYPDVIESVSYKGPAAKIKTHHNVGGLPERMSLKVIEPLRELFKDEVRSLGLSLGLEDESIWRHPFPGPGLAIRILGDITVERLDMLRHADRIFIEELHTSGHYRKIGQAFAVLLPVKTVGVMGDGRTYEQLVALRAVASTDFMTADWYHLPYEVLGKVSNRIINEVSGINRVAYDISSKPPATIEWE